MRLAVFSALPHELRQTIRNSKPARTVKKPFRICFVKHLSHEISLVQTGIGTRNAEAALQYILKEVAPDFVVSMGFGGALYNGAKAGDLVWASKIFFITDRVEGALEVPGAVEIADRLCSKVIMREGTVVTLQRWMNKSEIKKVMPELSLPVCDMETFPLAKLSIQRELPFFAFRSITDTAEEEIPQELLGVSDESGEYRLSRGLKVLLSRPRLIPKATRLGKTSIKASHHLWCALSALLEIL